MYANKTRSLRVVRKSSKETSGRKQSSAWSSKCRTFKASDSFPRVQPRKTWNEAIRSDLKERKVSKDISKDRNAQKFFIKNIKHGKQTLKWL